MEVNKVNGADNVPEEKGGNPVYHASLTWILSNISNDAHFSADGLTADSCIAIKLAVKGAVAKYEAGGIPIDELNHIQKFAKIITSSGGDQLLQGLGALINYASQIDPQLTDSAKTNIYNCYETQVAYQSGDDLFRGFEALQMESACGVHPDQKSSIQEAYHVEVAGKSGSQLVIWINRFTQYLYNQVWSQSH